MKNALSADDPFILIARPHLNSYFPSAQLVWQIGDAGRTTEQMAELLELPLKEARRLLGVGLTTANWDAAIAIDHDLCSNGVERAKDFVRTSCWMDQRLLAQAPG